MALIGLLLVLSVRRVCLVSCERSLTRNQSLFRPVAGKLYLYLDGGGWLTPRLRHFTPWKECRYPLYRSLGGPVWTDEESVGLTRIRSTDRPACSESLYRLSYHGPSWTESKYMNIAQYCPETIQSFVLCCTIYCVSETRFG